MSTERLYLVDDQLCDTITTIKAIAPGMFAPAASPFFVGGGGQPADCGWVDGVPITAISVDDQDLVWHHTDAQVTIGQTVHIVVDALHRMHVSRYHTALHILNTLALTHYDAWLTGAAITPTYGRIDVAIPHIDGDMIENLQAKMNAVITANHGVRAYTIPASEFERRTDLLRTINVKPPVYQGRIRVVEIVGFDAQACGGTHVRHTNAIGPCEIYKTENKGRQNKRLYVRFAPI